MITGAVMCLALNIYHEARSQSLVEQLAVSFVVMNRVDSEKYPDTVCDVVYQAKFHKSNPNLPIRNACQFSWFCNGIKDEPTQQKAWEDAQYVARRVIYKEIPNFMEGADHYHATYVFPNWGINNADKVVAKIGAHVFYNLED